MFHIKICGVRRLVDVRWASDSGADAIGLNFFPPSPRYIAPSESTSTELSLLAAERGLLRVGVFVNATAEEIVQIVRQTGIDAIQLHGDEPLEMVPQLKTSSSLPLIRAIKLPTGRLTIPQIDRQVQPWIEANVHPLFDADAGAAHGGSGKTLDWESIRRWSESNSNVAFTLAGGLNPNNVSGAIKQSKTSSVDTASGVEGARGVKDRDLIEAFVRASRQQLQN